MTIPCKNCIVKAMCNARVKRFYKKPRYLVGEITSCELFSKWLTGSTPSIYNEKLKIFCKTFRLNIEPESDVNLLRHLSPCALCNKKSDCAERLVSKLMKDHCSLCVRRHSTYRGSFRATFNPTTSFKIAVYDCFYSIQCEDVSIYLSRIYERHLCSNPIHLVKPALGEEIIKIIRLEYYLS